MRYSLDELGESYPRLYNLFGAYFHEDWVPMYRDSPKAAIDDFKNAQDANAIRETVVEIDALLSQFNNIDLAKVIDRLGNCYNYENSGFNARTWLAEISRELEPQADSKITFGK